MLTISPFATHDAARTRAIAMEARGYRTEIVRLASALAGGSFAIRAERAASPAIHEGIDPDADNDLPPVRVWVQ